MSSFIIYFLHENKSRKTDRRDVGEMKNTYKILDEKSERKRSLAKPSRTREDNISKDRKETDFDNVDWNPVAGQGMFEFHKSRGIC
jgi:hypothetical protein